MGEEKIYHSIIKTIQENHQGNLVKPQVIPRTLMDFFIELDRKLIIPSYQRPYSWQKANIDDYLDDINTVSTNKNNSWFIGSIFFTTDKQSHKNIFLLDGQQRITTTQILVWNLFLLFKEFKEMLSEQLRQVLLNDEEKNEKLKRFLDLEVSLKNILIDSNSEIRFQLRDELNTAWWKYIEGIKYDQVKTLSQSKDWFKKQISKDLDKLEKQGFPSGKVFSKAQEIIRSRLSKRFLDPLTDGDTPLSFEDLIFKFTDYCDSLLKRFWLISIELNDVNDSLRIFEGINNRGKSLSLTDKLRFKCLVECKSDNIREKVREHWKKAYSLIEHLQSSKFIKNDDDFFTYLLLSLSDKDLSNERERMSFFLTFLKSDDHIEEFCLKMLRVLNHLKYLDQYRDNGFKIKYNGEDGFNEKQLIEYGQSLFSLFRRVIFYSDNSRYLYFNLIANSKIESPNETTSDILVIMYDIVRIVIHFEVIKNQQSNFIRELYLKIVFDTNKNKRHKNLYNQIRKLDYISEPHLLKFKGSEIIENLISGKNINKDTLLFYYVAYKENHTSLINNLISYKSGSTHVEHIFPQSWIETDWKDKSFKFGEIEEYLTANREHFGAELVEASLSLKNELLLSNENRKGKPQKHPTFSLGQWIGNKCVTHEKVNRPMSNLPFNKKIEKIESTDYIVIPKFNDSRLGLNKYSKDGFDFKSILSRSFEMSKLVLTNLNQNDWTPNS